MNKQRRKELANIAQLIEDLGTDVQTHLDEESEYYDNMPEGIQAGDKGDDSQAAVDALQEAIQALEEAVEQINAAQG